MLRSQGGYADSPPFKMLNFKNNSDSPKFKLHIPYLEDRKHLPVVEIKEAA